MKLNLACGNCKLPGYINVDANPDVNPDQQVDICGFLPWETESADEIILFHAIEHMEKKYHPSIFAEFHRVLKPSGKLILGYPEFSVCIRYWLDNYLGKRDFWEACIYGRQTDPKDFHVTAMHTPEVLDLLRTVGFDELTHRAEADNPQYTVLKAVKGQPRISYEASIKELIFE